MLFRGFFISPLHFTNTRKKLEIDPIVANKLEKAVPLVFREHLEMFYTSSVISEQSCC